MSIIKGERLVVPMPDNLTIVQFMLDTFNHPTKPNRDGIPWYIDSESGKTVGYEELRTRVQGLANGLSRKWNISETSTVCIFAPNHIDYSVVVWACHRLGATVSPGNPDYAVDELLHQLKLSKATYIITVHSCLPVVTKAAASRGISSEHILLLDHAPGFLSINDLIKDGLDSEPNFKERTLLPGEAKTKLAFLCFSSGTTGLPKAVAISHYAVISNIIQMSVMNKANQDYAPWTERCFRPGQVALAVLPFFHVYGLIILMGFFSHVGSTLVVMQKFNLTRMLDTIIRHRITQIPLIPPIAVLLAKHPLVKQYDLSFVRLILSGAAPFSGELLEQLIPIFPNARIGQGYGMTETATAVCLHPILQRYSIGDSSGSLLPGCEAKIVKLGGSLATSPGEEGELLVKSPSLALGYFNNPDATAESFVDGWLRTGDIAYFDENEEIHITDRLKEFLKVRGFQVAPAELEGHLLTHSAVADVCVIGVLHDYSGELPKAYVALSEDAAETIKGDPAAAERLKEALKKHVADTKIAYKRLEGGVEFIDTIPKSSSGKLLRRILRDRARAERRANPVPSLQQAKM